MSFNGSDVGDEGWRLERYWSLKRWMFEMNEKWKMSLKYDKNEWMRWEGWKISTIHIDLVESNQSERWFETEVETYLIQIKHLYDLNQNWTSTLQWLFFRIKLFGDSNQVGRGNMLRISQYLFDSWNMVIWTIHTYLSLTWIMLKYYSIHQ